MLLRPTFEGRPLNSCTRMLPRTLQFFPSGTWERQFRDPGEHMGPNFSLSLFAGDVACWGQGQSEMGSNSRVWCHCWKGLNSPGTGTASAQSSACVQLRGTVNELLH